MPRGGRRSGAGRKRGQCNQATISKQIAEEEYRRFMLEDRRTLWLGQRERACGAYILLLKTKDGYERVTDAAQIDQIMLFPGNLVRGKDYWFIECRPPDPVLAKEVNNRVMGMPTQPVEVAGAGGGAVTVQIIHQQLKD